MNNPYSHLYLYAKGHYQKSNTIDDLKRILANYAGIDVRDITLVNLTEWVLRGTLPHIREKNDHVLIDFFLSLTPSNDWRFGFDVAQDVPPYDSGYLPRLISRCLSTLALAQVWDGSNLLIKLDVPHANILPLKNASVMA